MVIYFLGSNGDSIMKNAIEKLGKQKVASLVKKFSKEFKIPKDLHIDYVLNACIAKPGLAPDMNKKRKKKLSEDECVRAWVKKFSDGYENRISQHSSKPPATKADTAVTHIIKKVTNCKEEDANKIIFAHRLGMSAENILGLLLEEFLFKKLSKAGWVMAWGSTISHVDFCNANADVLQIKNRDNSENSSSKTVRDGEVIFLWVRGNSKTGETNWAQLKTLLQLPQTVTGLNEKNFEKYIEKILGDNPRILALDADNPWIKQGKENEKCDK